MNQQKCTQFFDNTIDSTPSTYMINPKTNRYIEKYKKTFNDMYDSCYKSYHKCSKEENNIGFLHYDSQSCYKDTIMFSLFYQRNHYIDSTFISRDVFDNSRPDCNLTKIQACFRNLAFQLRFEFLNTSKIGSEHWNTHLTDIFDSCLGDNCVGEFIEDITNGLQNDPSLFIRTIFELFPFPKNYQGIVKSTSYLYKSKSDKKPKVNDIANDDTCPIFNVEATETMKKNGNMVTELRSLLKQSIEETYNPPLLLNSPVASFIKRKTVTWIEKLPKILFIIVGRRTYIEQASLDFKLFPTPIIKKGGATRALFSIICRTSMKGGFGHYVCFFRCADKWFFYNDLNYPIKYIGTFEDLLIHSQHGTKVLRNSVVLMYSVANQTDIECFKSSSFYMEKLSLTIETQQSQSDQDDIYQ